MTGVRPLGPSGFTSQKDQMWSFLVTATPIECMESSSWIVPDLQRQFDPHVRELFFHVDGGMGYLRGGVDCSDE